jgi:putative ABC transport system permease protein
MDWLKRDLRLGLRLLARDRAWSATVLLTLALCIGANTALFAVVYNVLLRRLPVPEPDRVLLVSNLYPKAGVTDSSNSGAPDCYDRMRAVSVLKEQAVFNHTSVAVAQEGLPTRIRVANVTPSFFRVFPSESFTGARSRTPRGRSATRGRSC